MSGSKASDYYASKTGSLLAKYGPGPRVHFHVGFAEAVDAASDDARLLRRRLVAAQECVLEESAQAWSSLSPRLSGDLLDVGCGLGGGALFFAARFGARVVALTDVPDHARRVRRFAARLGLSERVVPVVADAHAAPLRGVFDAALAIESSCYFDRDAWFADLRRTLRPEGRVLLVDGFLGDPAAKRDFDAYWHTDIAPFAAYLEAARRQGFELEKQERLNARAIGFWELSRAWTRRTLADATLPAATRRRLERSLAAHARFQDMYARGAVEYLRVAFRRVAGER